ncbi:hypothetical protein B0H11DRAFT_2260072 [Mycena galericulata]|nr:hypothetical protein B0H11DRAFT_2260072 [Mycena galericulata]
MPPSLDHENACPKCQAYLVIKFAAGGQNASHFYINCHLCRYFYAFPTRDEPPTVAYIGAHPNWAPATSNQTATSGDAPTPAQSRADKCVSSSCGRKAPAACVYSRCKTHCVVEKRGCLAAGHQPERLTARQRAKHRTDTPPPSSQARSLRPSSQARPLPPSSQVRLSSLPPQLQECLDEAVAAFTPPRVYHLPVNNVEKNLEDDARREEEEDRDQDIQLRLLTDVTPLTAEERAAVDEANMQLAIALSKNTPQPSASHPSSSHASSSSLAPASSSSSLRPSLRPVYPTGKEPALRPSNPPPHAQPKKTTQMSQTWMRQYRDDTASDAAAAKQKLYKTSLDLTNGRKFTLVFLGLASSDPVVKSIRSIPRWPVWVVSDSPELLVRLGIEPDTVLEVLDDTINYWVEIELSHPHKLTADCTLVLRIAGALPNARFKELIDTINTKPLHLRKNLPGEHQFVRRRLRNQTVIEIDSDDDDNGAKRRKRKAADVFSDEDFATQRTRRKGKGKAVEVVSDSDVEVVSQETRPSSPLPEEDEDFPDTIDVPRPLARTTRPALHITIPTISCSTTTTATTTSAADTESNCRTCRTLPPDHYISPGRSPVRHPGHDRRTSHFPFVLLSSGNNFRAPETFRLGRGFSRPKTAPETNSFRSGLGRP